MKINIEAQHAVALSHPRGVGHYSIQLIQSLLRRNTFDYSLSFFDINHENGNSERAQTLFGKFNVPLCECTGLDYRMAIRDEKVFDFKSYNEYTKTDADIYHFTNFLTIPTRLDGKMLSTVLDLNWIPYEEGTSPVIRELLKIAIERMNKIKPDTIAISESTKREILEYTDIPADKIHVVYLSYDEENLFPDKQNRFNIHPVLDDNYEYLFFVGTFERKKNVVRIVKAFEQIADKFKGLRLVLSGKPTWDDPGLIYDTIEKSVFKDRIIVTGYIDTDTKRLLYSNAMGLIFPSICEGFGIPILEAMACGCPVITSDSTSMPEVGGNAVIYVNALDTEQLAFEMERLVNMESLRKEMVAKGLKQAKNFSWNKSACEIEKVYKLMMGKIQNKCSRYQIVKTL